MGIFKNKIGRLINVKKTEEEFNENMENIQLEKNDGLAMVLAALITFIPALLVVIGFFIAVIYFFFLR